jgi:multiple sugar transport system substrate-binding protein
VSAPNGGFNDQQFLAAVASGNPPDLVYMDRAKVGTYAADGALQPLTSCISSQKIPIKDYRPAALSQVTYKGKVFGIPEFFDVRTIIADYDVMKSSGVTLAQMNTAKPATLRAAALKMYQHNGSQVTRIGFDPKLPEFFPLWAKVFGVDILSPNGLVPHLNDPRAVKALTYAYGLIQAQGGYNAFLSFRNTWDFFGSDNQVAKDQVGAWPMEDWYVNVTNDRNRRLERPDRRTRAILASRILPNNADASADSTNLAFQPRAGNISSDTRAGRAG